MALETRGVNAIAEFRAFGHHWQLISAAGEKVSNDSICLQVSRAALIEQLQQACQQLTAAFFRGEAKWARHPLLGLLGFEPGAARQTDRGWALNTTGQMLAPAQASSSHKDINQESGDQGEPIDTTNP